MQGPLSDSASAPGPGSGLGSIDLFSKVEPEASTAPNSTSPSDDDSVTDKHNDPVKNARVLDENDSDDMDVNSDDLEEISPLVKKVKSHVGSSEIPEPHHKDRKVNPVWNYYKKSIKMESTRMIKTQQALCQVKVEAAICGKRMAMPQASTTGPRNHLKNNST